MEKLASVGQSMVELKKALRELIQTRDDEIDRLERFEDHFNSVNDNYIKFRERVLKNEKPTNELKVRLEREISKHRQSLENLRITNARLRQANQEKRLEKESLEQEYNEVFEKLRKLNQINDHNTVYANATSSPLYNNNSVVQRLFNDDCN